MRREKSSTTRNRSKNPHVIRKAPDDQRKPQLQQILKSDEYNDAKDQDPS